jgi:hypothetical protein
MKHADRGSDIEKLVYPQVIDFQENHTELTGYAEACIGKNQGHIQHFRKYRN